MDTTLVWEHIPIISQFFVKYALVSEWQNILEYLESSEVLLVF